MLIRLIASRAHCKLHQQPQFYRLRCKMLSDFCESVAVGASVLLIHIISLIDINLCLWNLIERNWKSVKSTASTKNNHINTRCARNITEKTVNENDEKKGILYVIIYIRMYAWLPWTRGPCFTHHQQIMIERWKAWQLFFTLMRHSLTVYPVSESWFEPTKNISSHFFRSSHSIQCFNTL